VGEPCQGHKWIHDRLVLPGVGEATDEKAITYRPHGSLMYLGSFLGSCTCPAWPYVAIASSNIVSVISREENHDFLVGGTK